MNLCPLAFALIVAYFTLRTMPEGFPPVEGGGSLILAWQIRNKRVLVVGGGEVSSMHLLSSSLAVVTDHRLFRWQQAAYSTFLMRTPK